MLLSLIGSFQLFELPFILLNGPGPENRGLTVVMYPYQRGFEVGELGYASAIGWTLALVLMGLTVIQRMGRGAARSATTPPWPTRSPPPVRPRYTHRARAKVGGRLPFRQGRPVRRGSRGGADSYSAISAASAGCNRWDQATGGGATAV